MAELAEIRAFLEGQGFLFGQTPFTESDKVFGAWLYGEGFTAWDEKTLYMNCLSHFLSYWLGAHWASVHEYLEQTPPALETAMPTIEKAIAYYESLEKEGQA